MKQLARIRAATESDMEAMTQLIARLFALEPDYPFDAAKVHRGIDLLRAREDAAALWVAELGDRLVGMCSAQIIISTAEGGPVAWVEDVVVSPELRAQSIGRMLLDAVTAWAKRRGISRLQLLVDRENEVAQGFYRHLGWKNTRMICFRLHPGE